MNFSLQFTNVDNGTRHFPTLDEAIAAGRKAGFEFSVWLSGNIVVSWTVFGGLKRW